MARDKAQLEGEVLAPPAVEEQAPVSEPEAQPEPQVESVVVEDVTPAQDPAEVPGRVHVPDTFVARVIPGR